MMPISTQTMRNIVTIMIQYHITVKRLTYCYCLLVCSLLSGDLLAQQSPEHLPDQSTTYNGIATYSNLGRDLYLVAYSTAQSCNNTTDCLNAEQTQRFTLKVLNKRWHARNYTLTWQTDLAINNQKPPSKTVMKHIIDFSKLAQSSLTLGDTIDIIYDKSYSKILVNQQLAIQASGQSLFRYISRVWLGTTPPSQEFQSDLLRGHNQVNTALIEKFEAILPSPDRLTLLKRWQTEKIQQKAITKTTIIATQKTTVDNAAPKTLKPKIDEPEVGFDDDTIIKQTTPIKPAITQASKKAKKVKKPAPTTKRLSESERYEYLHWQLKKAIYKNVKYPEWARQFGEEGQVSVNYTVNEKLELVNINSITPKLAGLLGEAVVTAIKNTLPLKQEREIELPKQLSFEYTHAFSIQDKSSAPPAPEFVNKKLASNLAVSQNTLDSLRKHLASFVKKPFWAKDLRRDNRVIVRITINKEGEIAQQELVKGSKKPGLNQAVLKALKAAEPFPTQGLYFEQQELTFNYIHHFTP